MRLRFCTAICTNILIHDSNQDVTGGIFLKAQSASEISQNVDDVWLIDGRKPERILELVETGNTIGTKVI